MYQIIIKKKAKKFIDKLPANERKWVVSAIEQLPNGEDIKKIQGYDELLRLRVGDYRIIYSVDNGELIVYVVDAGNRGDIYKRYKQGAIKITLSKAQRKANDKYIKENYSQVKLSMPKEEAETLDRYCKEKGYTKAGFIRQAIKDKMERNEQNI